jgi:hypothetical protein
MRRCRIAARFANHFQTKMSKSWLFLICVACIVAIGLANLVGCIAISCSELDDFTAYSLSAVAGPVFPFFTSPSGSGASTHWLYTMICALVVVAVVLLFRKFSGKAAFFAGGATWGLIGIFSLFLYRV